MNETIHIFFLSYDDVKCVKLDEFKIVMCSSQKQTAAHIKAEGEELSN